MKNSKEKKSVIRPEIVSRYDRITEQNVKHPIYDNIEGTLLKRKTDGRYFISKNNDDGHGIMYAVNKEFAKNFDSGIIEDTNE